MVKISESYLTYNTVNSISVNTVIVTKPPLQVNFTLLPTTQISNPNGISKLRMLWSN